MIIDSHVHVGWFSDGYHSPNEIWHTLRSAGIEKAVVSSTSACSELYSNIKTEFQQLIAIAGKQNLIPILWVTPDMIQKKWPLKKLLKSNIEWRGIKIHCVSHPQFSIFEDLIEEVISASKILGKLPILIHTGEWPLCKAGNFESIIKRHPDIKFVLAHGRPINETIYIMKKYSNVWTDTAFMPINDVIKLKREHLIDRTMFGTDAPINRIYFKNISTKNYLRDRIEKFKELAPEILSNCIYTH